MKSSPECQGTAFEATHCYNTKLSEFSPTLNHRFTVKLKKKLGFKNFPRGQVGQQNENKDMYEIPAAYRENEIRVKRQLSDLSLSRPQISGGRELSQYEISIIWKDWHLQYSYKMFVGMKVKHIMVCFKSYKSSWDNYFPRSSVFENSSL